MSEQVVQHGLSSYKPAQLATLTRRALTGNYKPHSSPERISCVVVPSFGQRVQGGRVLPGKSNQAIARILRERFPGIPVIGSFQIDDALKEIGHKAELRLGEPGEFFETYKVVKGAARFIMATKLLQDGSVAVIGDQYHLPRSDAAMQATLPADEETFVPPDIDIPWDKESSQLWTRSPFWWKAREPVAIARYAMYGWLDLTHASAWT